MTFIQSLNLVYRIFTFDMYSFVIKIVTDVNGAVLDDIKRPALGFKIANVLNSIAEADPIEISVIINITFFYLNFCTSFFKI